jgi:hypothetical protein
MHLAVMHGVALSQGADATARAIAAELERRGLPGAETIVLHRQRERQAGRLLPLAGPDGMGTLA